MTHLTVHVRITDAGTGKPTPVCFRITTTDGQAFAPLGRPMQFALGRHEDVGGQLMLGRERWWHIDGSCEIRLPTQTPLIVEVTKGPEYSPIRHEVTLGAGQMALRLTIRRWIDRRTEGWFSGDSRAHDIPPHTALLEGEAEGLAIVNVLAAATLWPGQDGRLYDAVPNLLAFSGQSPAVASAECQVVVNTLNTHPVLGQLGLLHCHRPVFPLAFGGADGAEDWSLEDWCHQCHRKSGLVVWVRPFSGSGGFGGEALADLILGFIDALEIDATVAAGAAVLREWATLLNAGLRVPLVGGSGKDSNRVPLGAMRTYARLPAGMAFTLRDWIEAVRVGRTFITNGPLLTFSVDGHESGAIVEVPESQETVTVRAEAVSVKPFDRLEVIANGEVVARGTDHVELALPVGDGGWLAARCWTTSAEPQFAHSSAVFVRRRGRPVAVSTSAQNTLIRQLDRLADWGREEARFDSDPRREQFFGRIDAARRRLLATDDDGATISPSPSSW